MTSKRQKQRKKEIYKIMFLNIEASARMQLNYYMEILRFLFWHPNEKMARAHLYTYIDEYVETIRLENEILLFLKKYISKIENVSAVDDILDILYEKNLDTYLAYVQILEDYEMRMEMEHFDYLRFKRKINCSQIDETVKEELLCEIVGSTVTRKDIEEFLKENGFSSEFFEYIQDHQKVISELTNEEMREFSGVFFQEEKNILKAFRLFLPAVENLLSAKIVIHELVHGKEAYAFLKKEYKGENEEEKAKIYEKKFVDEYILPRTKK